MAIDTIGTNAIANDAVTAAKIPAGAVDADITAIPDGSVTTSKIADNAVTSAKALNLGRRNLIINGGMTVSQRGTTFADLASGGYGVDRFVVFHSDDGAVTVTQDTTVPAGQGFKNSMKFDVTTADTSIGAAQFYQFSQKIEGQNMAHLEWGTSNAKSVTLSFWIRSNLTGTYNVYFLNNATDRYHPVNFTIDSANTWEKKIITVAGDTTGTWLTTNGVGMFVLWNLALGSNNLTGTNATWGTAGPGVSGTTQANFLSSTSNELYLTGVQLEVGEQATEFEHRSYAEELRDCHRYFCKYVAQAQYFNFAIGRSYNTTNGTSVMSTPQPMRALPTLTTSTVSGGFTYGHSALTLSAHEDLNFQRFTLASTGAFTANGGYAVEANAADIFMAFSAEL